MRGLFLAGVILASLTAWGRDEAMDDANARILKADKDKQMLDAEIRQLERDSVRRQRLLAEKQEKLRAMQRELSQMQAMRDQQLSRIKELEAAEQATAADVTSLEKQFADFSAEVERATARENALAESMKKARDELLARKAELIAQKALMKNRQAEAETNRQTGTDEVARLRAEVTRLETELANKNAGRKKAPARQPSNRFEDFQESAEDGGAKSYRLFTVDPKRR